MSIERVYPTFEKASFEALHEIGVNGSKSFGKQFSMLKKIVLVAAVTFPSMQSDLLLVVDILGDMKRVTHFKSLAGRLSSLDAKFSSRGKLNRLLYLVRLASGVIKCSLVLGRFGLLDLQQSLDLGKGVVWGGRVFSVTLNAGVALTALSVASLTIGMVKDLNKMHQLIFSPERAERVDVDYLLVVHAVHLVKSGAKIAQLALLIAGVSNPILSLGFVVVTMGLSVGYDFVRSQAIQGYFVGVPVTPEHKPEVTPQFPTAQKKALTAALRNGYKHHALNI